ncbi:MAG: prepilin-type N-terminal cleavage/methylation domain-containing protein [Burkholderiales bacterium]|nr:prepilin-type N-terminal cleavage/methylation domain-containing protein [Burkholderiales bacterium]
MPRLSGAGASRGFTLLEVLIALSLMAVLAVLGWRGLDSVLVTRERLTRSSADLAALSVCFTQLEEDLRRAWPVRLLGLPVPAVGFSVPQADEPAAPLQLLREPPAGGVPGTVQRVSYRLRAGTLARGFAPWAAPAPDGTASQQGLIWQPLVTDVASLRMRGFVAGTGWVDGAALAAQPMTPSAPTGGAGAGAGQPPAPALVPIVVSGLEVELERVGGERLLRVFSVKD